MKLSNSFTDLLDQGGVDPKVTRWIGIIFFSIFGLIIFFTIFSEKSKGNCLRYYDFINSQFEGIIQRKFENQQEHGYQTIVLEDGIYNYSLESISETSIFQDIRIGDKIIKKAGELKCILIQKNDTLLYELKIKDCEPYLKK